MPPYCNSLTQYNFPLNVKCCRMANRETANPRLNRNQTKLRQWVRVLWDCTQRKNKANSAEYFSNSIRVRNGTAVMPTANWNAATSQNARSGHSSGFQINFHSLSVNAFQDQSSSKTAA